MTDTHTTELIISSSAFQHEGDIPSRHTCEGKGINPPLFIRQLPLDTKSLAIILEDPDATRGTFDHWLLWNIDPVTNIDEDEPVGISGINSSGKTGYYPPCPPGGSHRYYFHVYALDNLLDLPATADKSAMQAAMQNHIIAEGTLMGRYQKKGGSVN